MKSSRPVGLVGAGGVAQSYLSRLPALLKQLGPVKGNPLRVSKRIANSLRAGFGVGNYRALASCESIWISVPEKSLKSVVTHLASAIPLEGRNIVLCGVLRNGGPSSELRASGARVATLNCVPHSHERIFVAEGDFSVAAELKALLASDRRKLIMLKPDGTTAYALGLLFANSMLLPWIAGAVESLRASGLSRSEAAAAVQLLGNQALRDYARAGPKAWDSESAASLREAINGDIDSIRWADPNLAALYTQSFEPAAIMFGERKPMDRTIRRSLATLKVVTARTG